MPILKYIDPVTMKVVKQECDHTIGKWGDDLRTIIELENSTPERIDMDTGKMIVYADASAWLDKKLFYHTRFKYCPDCGKKLDFRTIRKRLERICEFG